MRLVIVFLLITFTFVAWQYNQDEPQSIPDKVPKPNTIESFSHSPETVERTIKDEDDSPKNSERVTKILIDEDVLEANHEDRVIKIGEYIDVDALPVDDGREPINIGEYIDVDAIPADDGRPPINIGEYIGDPDDPTFLNNQYQEPVNIGEYLPPPGDYDPGALGEYTEPVNIGESIYTDEDISGYP